MKIMNIQSCSCPEATTGCIPGILLPLAHVATVRRSHGSNGASGPGEIWQMEPLAYRLTKIWGLMVGPSAYQPISYNISNISCVSFLHLVGQESLAEREMFQSLRSPQGSPNSFADAGFPSPRRRKMTRLATEHENLCWRMRGKSPKAPRVKSYLTLKMTITEVAISASIG